MFAPLQNWRILITAPFLTVPVPMPCARADSTRQVQVNSLSDVFDSKLVVIYRLNFGLETRNS